MNKILILGDLIIDKYLFGSSDRISPEAPVPVVNFIKEETYLGGAGNVFRNLLSLECDSKFICVTNQPLNYLSKINGFDSNSVECIVDNSIISPEKKRIISNNQQIVRIDKEVNKDLSNESHKQVIDILTKNLNNISVVILSDYSKGVLTKKLCKEIIEICNSSNIKVLVDPKNKIQCFKGAYLFKPNLNELNYFLKLSNIENSNLEQSIIKLKLKYDFKNIMVTMGSEGILYYDGNDFTYSKQKEVEVYDVSGAGDTVISAFAQCIIEKKELSETLDYCNKAAAIVISKFGTAVTTKKEIYEKN